MKERIEGLRAAVERDSEAWALREMLAEMLDAVGESEQALDEWERLVDADQLDGDRLVAVGRQAAGAGRVELARRCAEAARRGGVVEGVAELETEIGGALEELEVPKLRVIDGGTPKRSSVDEESTTFAEVGGLDEVKKAIHRMIILPFRRPELYARYRRSAGGGVMLFGPPGCGKTLLARATAGECGAAFVNVRIEEVLSPWLGESEANIHAAFEEARAHRPAVVFLDEIDALAFARRKQRSGSAMRSLVDQLLQELDAIGTDNRELLVVAATNAPWDVDDALKRPGRFDRVLFVPPPDETARRAILTRLLDERPTDRVEAKALARRTSLWSGADLVALVERATDEAIEEALTRGTEPPLGQEHFDGAISQLRPTTLDWLARARNYVEFANQDSRYDEVARFLKSREVKRFGRAIED